MKVFRQKAHDPIYWRSFPQSEKEGTKKGIGLADIVINIGKTDVVGQERGAPVLSTTCIPRFWVFVQCLSAPPLDACRMQFSLLSLFSVSFGFLLARVALKLRSLRIRPPRLCRL